jgi:hypothetical protein
MSNQLKANVSLAFFLLINILFSIKYFIRYTEYYFLISFFLLVLSLSILKLSYLIKLKTEKLNYIIILLSIIFVVCFIFVFQKIPQNSLKVDRWSVMASFWDNYFCSEYVYFGKSHNGNLPGPMPFYFVLALPFYWLKEFGYLSLLGFILFLAILKYLRASSTTILVALVLVVLSSSYHWEVVSRSNIFLNSSLMLFGIVFFLKSIQKKMLSNVCLNGILFGLVLSTRNVLIIPLIILFLFVLKFRLISWREIMVLSLITLLTFSATFIPFVYNHFAEFLQMNPFVIQSSFLLPKQISFLLVLVSFLSYFIVNKPSDVIFYSGMMLLITIFSYFIYQIYQYGFQNAYFGSFADISYIILSAPFFLFHFLVPKFDSVLVKAQ